MSSKIQVGSLVVPLDYEFEHFRAVVGPSEPDVIGVPAKVLTIENTGIAFLEGHQRWWPLAALVPAATGEPSIDLHDLAAKVLLLEEIDSADREAVHDALKRLSILETALAQDQDRIALAREKERSQKLHRRLITAEAALGTKRELAGVMEENRELRENNRRLKAYAERTQKQAADAMVDRDKAVAECEALRRKDQTQCIYCDALMPKSELLGHLKNCGMQSELMVKEEALAARELEISKLRQELIITQGARDQLAKAFAELKVEKGELRTTLAATEPAISAVRFLRTCKCGFAARGNCEHYHGLFGFALPPLPVGKE